MATSQRWLLAWKMSTIWIASGKHSSARVQIQGAPSPRMTLRSASAKRRRSASRQTRWAKGEGSRSGIATGGRLDGGRVGDGIRVAHRDAGLGVTAFGRPGDRELDLAGFGRTVGLLALALRGFGLAHGNACTVDAEIQGRLRAVRLRLDGLAFVGCDRAPQRFGGPLDLLGVDSEPGQFVQQGAGLLEADSGGRRRRHAGRRGRQRRLVDAQGPVPRTESGSAGLAMVVGPLQGHGAQGRADRLCPPAGVAGRVSAPAGQAGGVLVTVVGVEPLGNETRGHRQDGGAHRGLGRLEVAQSLRRVGPQQPLDLTCRFGRQRLGEPRGLRFFLLHCRSPDALRSVHR